MYCAAATMIVMFHLCCRWRRFSSIK